ncbi:MAG: gluconolactonase [Pseudomonadota bacterium]|jgi:sugar lactone lactonase YvrE
MALSAPECIWPLDATLGEGPVWWDGALWFTDIKQQTLHRFDPAGGTQSWPAPSPVGFLAPRRSGHFIAGAKTGLYDFDPGNGTFALIRTVEPDRPGNRLNDGAVDAKGRLWFGSMDDDERAATGKLYRLEDGGLTAMDEGYVITNGPAFSPDGATLYHTDTLEKIIWAFDVDEAGALSNRRVFVRIEDGAGYPDGCVVDAQGCLWTGLFGGWAARRYSPQGALLESVKFPTANVTKLAFGGDDLATVHATTATKGLTPGDRAAQPLAGGLFRFTAAVPGLPQNAVSF